jgi:Uncharacterized conserved protein
MIVVYAKSIVVEKNVEKFLQLAKELIEETRKENGNVSYELVRGTENKSIFAFIEKWADKEVLDTHMKTKHFTTIIPELLKLSVGDMEISVHEVII